MRYSFDKSEIDSFISCEEFKKNIKYIKFLMEFKTNTQIK